MTIIEKLNLFKKERDLAQQRIQEMETDILTTIKAIQEACELVGLSEELQKIQQSKSTKKISTGSIMMNIVPKLLTRKIPKKRLEELYKEIVPMLHKYKHLYDEDITQQTEQKNIEVDNLKTLK